jgi:ubiquinone biosynthesis protein COQ4
VTSTDRPTWGFRLQPRAWLPLVRRVREDPGDVAVGARVFFSIGGHDEEPSWRRLVASATGSRLARERRPYPALFTDYERLRALPAGTLGREYVRELDARAICPVELARETEAAYVGRAFTPEHAYVRDRVRDAHDLFHTLTGYGIDVVGEAGVLSFTFGQTGNKGWAMLVLLNLLTSLLAGRIDTGRVAWAGYRCGRRARYLPAVADWERLLQTPLAEVRRELGIAPMRPYRPLDIDDAFARFARSAG